MTGRTKAPQQGGSAPKPPLLAAGAIGGNSIFPACRRSTQKIAPAALFSLHDYMPGTRNDGGFSMALARPEFGTNFDGGWRGLLRSKSQTSRFSCMVSGSGGSGGPSPTGAAAPFLRRSRLDFVAEFGTNFDDGLWGLAGCGRKFHRPAAAFFSTQPAGARADAPEGGCAPRDLGAAAPFFAAQPRRICSGIRNEFRRRVVRPRGMGEFFNHNQAPGLQLVESYGSERQGRGRLPQGSPKGETIDHREKDCRRQTEGCSEAKSTGNERIK
jgi:hypothetical protein